MTSTVVAGVAKTVNSNIVARSDIHNVAPTHLGNLARIRMVLLVVQIEAHCCSDPSEVH